MELKYTDKIVSSGASSVKNVSFLTPCASKSVNFAVYVSSEITGTLFA